MAVKTVWDPGEILTAYDVKNFLANSGLVYITSVDVPGGTSTVSVTDAFSLDFDDYLVKVSGLNIATSGNVNFQFETAGTPITTNYSLAGHYQTWGAAALVGFTDTQFGFPAIASGYDNSFHIEIQDPAKTEYSYIQSHFCNQSRAYWLNGKHELSTAYSDFRLTASYTLSGTDAHIDVYGYRHPN